MRLMSLYSALRGVRGRRRLFCTPEWIRCMSRTYTVVAKKTYEDAVDLLNTLQTPYAALQKRRAEGFIVDKAANEETRKLLTRIGYSQSDLSKVNIVHVAGTKGKGSTCAYVDSILSQYRKTHSIALKTGLFTSPHLIAVRERIRLNGVPLSQELFAKYFFEVWDAMGDADKPFYFRYLTLMSYHVFVREGVDVAISEVGLGGEYDATNIVERPMVTGISSLGIDHTYTLGKTIEEIAWHKAGIQKAGCPSFTVPQLPSAMKVLENRAKERRVESFKIVKEDPRLDGVNISPNAPFQRLNASLAIALAETILGKMDPNFHQSQDVLSKDFVEGLEKVAWRGRCEKKVEGNVTWYLDCAHTAESMIVASKWFGDECSQKSGKRVLIFNQQGDRESMQLLISLYTAITTQKLVEFNHVIFCPVSSQTDTASKKDFVNRAYDATAIAGLTMQKSFAEKWRELDQSAETKINVLPSVEDALEHVRRLGHEGSKDKREVQALITGSVHLVGRALGVLEGIDAVQ